MQERVQTLRNQLAEVQQRATEVQGRRAQVIRSPIAGRVATVQAKAGQSADPYSGSIWKSFRKNSQLQAELFVRPAPSASSRWASRCASSMTPFRISNSGAQSGKVT